MDPIFSIDEKTLARLSVESSVFAFRDLLWARAAEKSVPTTQISISSNVYTKDGGVDASILDGECSIEHDELLTQGTRFQIKTGVFSVWQRSKIKYELFKTKNPKFENLGNAVQRALKENKCLVIVCFGVDPVDDRLRKARDYFLEFFDTCGYPNAKVEVWGQTQLISLFQHYPSLCLRLRGHDLKGFRFRDSWASDEDMQPTIHYSPETNQLVEDLRNDIYSGDFPHLRLIGEPGIGKTRLAMEITNVENLAPSVLYIKDGRTFLDSSFINELIRSDDHRFVILVIDECPNKDRAEIWNTLKSKSDRIRLISIDHGPDDSVDNKMRKVNVEPAGTEEITLILKDYTNQLDAWRWAKFCEGCPRVAHVIGENLRENRHDLLQEPATVVVWDRFIIGNDASDTNEVQQRKTVLRYLSLFEKFGYLSPVEHEAKFIQRLLERHDPNLTWSRFVEIINLLKRRKILQGETTLYLTPQLLHIYLYRQFWELHGQGFGISETLNAMPRHLCPWFIQMMRYAHDCHPAEAAIDKLLGSSGIIPGKTFPDNQDSGRLINSLAETSPKQTLRCLKRTIGSMTSEQLLDLRYSRQYIVRTLEKIAVWEDCFVGSANVLLKLSETENTSDANSARRMFLKMFSLTPRVATTQASPEVRLIVLKDTLESKIPKIRWLGLDACKSALSHFEHFRFVGPEHQGIRKTIKFWIPETKQELWDARRDVWILLVAKLETWSGEDRSRLISTLISSAPSALYTPSLTAEVIGTLDLISKDSATDIKSLIELIGHQLRTGKDHFSCDARNKLISIRNNLNGHDFSSILQRYVKHITRDDYFDDEHERTNIVEKKLDALASEASSDHSLLLHELHWLVCVDSSPAFYFGVQLGKLDTGRTLLQAILKQQSDQKENATTSFLSGYLAAIYSRDVEEWEDVMLELAENLAVEDKFSDFAIGSGISDKVVKKVIEKCRSGKQDIDHLERWWLLTDIYKISPAVFDELVSLQIECGTGQAWSNAIHLSHSYYFHESGTCDLSEEYIFKLLTHRAMADGRVVYKAAFYWAKLTKAFLIQYPGRKWELFREVLRAGVNEWSVLRDLDGTDEQILTNILLEDPERGFDCITEIYSETKDNFCGGLQSWLSDEVHKMPGDESPGLNQDIPQHKIFKWIDEDPAQHGYWLIHILPKTLDKTVVDGLTREFLAKYGSDKSLSSALRTHFHNRSWSGNASNYYRKLREDARTWLIDEKSIIVRDWVDIYIEDLSREIAQSEIEEERE